ncbi:TPA: hypothetical protein ACH3X1_005359 [Trebouxia sp. C0004]
MDVKRILAMHRCPPSERDSGMEQLDNEKCHDTHDEGLGRPEVRRQMHEILTLSHSELDYSDCEAEQEAVAEPGRQKLGPNSRLGDWLTLPRLVLG